MAYRAEESKRTLQVGNIVYKCVVRVPRGAGDDVRGTFQWKFARHADLQVMADALQIGDWRIPYSEIEEAVLIHTSASWQEGYVLRLKMPGETIRLGLDAVPYWEGELPFPVIREEARHIPSAAKIILRFLLVIIGIVLFILALYYTTPEWKR